MGGQSPVEVWEDNRRNYAPATEMRNPGNTAVLGHVSWAVKGS